MTGCTSKSGPVISNVPDGTPSANGATSLTTPMENDNGALAGPLKPNASVLAGRQLFEVHCSGCHPGGQNRMVPNKPVIGSAQLASLQKFTQYLRNPGPGMQVFSPADLSDAQAEQIYAALQDVQLGSLKPATTVPH